MSCKEKKRCRRRGGDWLARAEADAPDRCSPSQAVRPKPSLADLTAEKMARGLLKSSVDKALSRNTTVIVDSCNGNKGYRYELWCIARLVRTHYCLLFVDTPEEQCRAWNAERTSARYTPEALEDALFRCVCDSSRFSRLFLGAKRGASTQGVRRP